MLNSLKRSVNNYTRTVKPHEWPAVALRGAALVLIVSHLIAFFFIYSHIIFISTGVVMGLLLAREMYEDLAQRFFRLKAEEYEKDLMELHEREHPQHPDEDPSLLIEGRASMKDISERNSRR
ncbi:hypothetical protein SAMN05444722_1749 [Rhodovulum sp. ES.010]|uniref:hypothetical protein n=1 Tax=Rhodovulum sp. ES.010 TaxID=1882821 RepID=UPI00092A5DCA|nr:hypothetical protein [Rhodovulum sp. ES.010]SIO37555.1 hypothetical protein SAMN05444722_1749 [Rhodovulum sp. ES.010]